MVKRSIQNVQCECSDPGCPIAHDGQCKRPAAMWLRRIDMDDGQTEIAFCEDCAGDALASGVFA